MLHDHVFLAEEHLLLHGRLDDNATEMDCVALYCAGPDVQWLFADRDHFYPAGAL
jgi:hypothetical protein